MRSHHCIPLFSAFGGRALRARIVVYNVYQFIAQNMTIIKIYILRAISNFSECKWHVRTRQGSTEASASVTPRIGCFGLGLGKSAKFTED